MLKTRIIAAAGLIVLLLALALWLPAVCMAVAVAVISAVGAYELLHTTGEVKLARLYIWPMSAAAAIPLGCFFGYGELILSCGIIFLLLALFAEAIFTYGSDRQVPFAYVLTGFFAGVVIPWCLSALVKIRALDNGGIMIIMAFVITAVSDTGGYFGGLLFGKHKGVLKTSPNKSIEGFIGSPVLGVAGILIFGLIIEKCCGLDVSYWKLIIYALGGNVTTQIGDLAFSVIKRQHGIKDYGNLIPGHGGVLDRFDSMIFTAPLIFIFVSYFPAF